MATPANTRITIADRMNRLPPAPYFQRLVARVSTGGLFEFYELFMAGAVGAALVHAKVMPVSGLAYFVGAGFLGMFFGTSIFGNISDKIGRRNGYVYSLLIYSFFTILMAFSPNAVWIDVFRLLAGFGVGAQLVVIDTYVSEMTPASRRGYYIAFSQFITYWAVPVVAFLAYTLVPTHVLMAGWRWVVLIGALGSVAVWWIRQGLPESPRWYENHGDITQANAVMQQIETTVAKEVGSLPPVRPGTEEHESRGHFREIWVPPYRSRTIMLLIFNLFQTIGFYGFAAWVPTLLVSEGITLIHSLLYTFLIALVNPLGPIIGMVMSDRWQRKWQIVVVSLSIGIAGLVFSQMRTPVGIITMGIVITLLNNWFSTLFHSYQAELYPTRIRATGVGFTYSWSRLSSALVGFIIVALLKSFGVLGVFAFISLAMAIVASVIGIMGPRTNGRSLEDISSV
ncbi:MFS transporter, putative metabolite:H+ symporter [Sulfobacillus thermosulfidooxidans DSM 9293]|uniref:MFS transporter n=2 Tax=Sulfobacillus thermosulfidooxidans TaxID=28034 RepID=A0A2T2WQZ8_SULTH|nr:MFS transporter [Sulfobacillus thermosulfidooxidans]PSR24671.1 MAG: MFS transporter [Sulfobacillus thermosulfidooxidans]SMC03679.1 MFS transporter, putative metabolite:H+ symporter [Sulfobacillus thermosulfidooxidans DSM 9293]